MKKILFVVLLLVIMFGASACTIESPSVPVASQAAEQNAVQANQEKMAVAVPLPSLSNSLERTNISKRLKTFDDPNKISYIYLINYGRVMTFYTLKGKVTSGNKRLTSTQQQVEARYSDYASGAINRTEIMEQPELDGTYGYSDPYIFFWTTDGIYVQWSGDYMLVDQPLKLSTQPELIREIK